MRYCFSATLVVYLGYRLLTNEDMRAFTQRLTQCFTQGDSLGAFDLTGCPRGSEWNSTQTFTQVSTHWTVSVVIAIVSIVIVIACI